MKRKIRWIHRRFPRYYQWWWGLNTGWKAGWLLYFPCLGLSAMINEDLTVQVIIALAFVGGLVAISISLQNFKKEDLCKYE